MLTEKCGWETYNDVKTSEAEVWFPKLSKVDSRSRSRHAVFVRNTSLLQCLAPKELNSTDQKVSKVNKPGKTLPCTNSADRAHRDLTTYPQAPSLRVPGRQHRLTLQDQAQPGLKKRLSLQVLKEQRTWKTNPRIGVQQQTTKITQSL